MPEASNHRIVGAVCDSAITSDGVGGDGDFPIKRAVPSRTVAGDLSQFSIGLLASGSGTPLLTAGVFVRYQAQWEDGETGLINCAIRHTPTNSA